MMSFSALKSFHLSKISVSFNVAVFKSLNLMNVSTIFLLNMPFFTSGNMVVAGYADLSFIDTLIYYFF